MWLLFTPRVDYLGLQLLNVRDKVVSHPAAPTERRMLFYMQVLAIRAEQHTQPTIMPRPKLTLYLDQVSPFAYFAFHVVRVSRFPFSMSTYKAGNGVL